MKKRIFAILFALVIFASSFGVVAYAETKLHVFGCNSLIDSAQISHEEVADLQIKAVDFERTYGYAVMLAVIDETLNASYTSAEDLYNSLTDNPNGMLLVHNLYTKEYEYYLAGECETVFADSADSIAEAYNETEEFYDGIVDYYIAAENAVTDFNDAAPEDEADGTYTDGAAEDVEDSEDLADDAAGEEMPALIDDAELFSEAEYKEIDAKFRDLSKKYGFEFVGATVNREELDGIDAKKYADFVYSVFSENGVKDVALYLYVHGDEGDKEIVITRYGKAEKELSDADCTKIIGNVKAKFEDGKYADGFKGFVEATEDVFNPSVHWIWIPVCLVVGFVVAYLIMKGIASANKSVRKKVNATDYVDGSSLMVTNAADIFLYSETKSTPKADNSTSSSDTDEGGRSTSSGRF